MKHVYAGDVVNFRLDSNYKAVATIIIRILGSIHVCRYVINSGPSCEHNQFFAWLHELHELPEDIY